MRARLTVTLEIFFKSPLPSMDEFIRAFMSNGFSLMNQEQGVLFKGKYTVRPSRFTRVKGKAINTAAIGISLDELHQFTNHIHSLLFILRDLNVGIDDIEYCSLLINSWIASGIAGKVITSIKSLDDEFPDYVYHRNPFGKIELVSKESSLDGRWSKIEIDYTEDDEYLISLHYYTDSIDGTVEFIVNSPNTLTGIVEALESSHSA